MMKLTFDILVVCYVLESSNAYFIHGYVPASRHLPQSLGRHKSISYSGNEDSQSDNEVYFSSHEKKHRHGHKHRKKTHIHHKKYIKSNRKRSFDCGASEGIEEYKQFYDEKCPKYYNIFQINPTTPKTIVIPYPLPVMLITAGYTGEESKDEKKEIKDEKKAIKDEKKESPPSTTKLDQSKRNTLQKLTVSLKTYTTDTPRPITMTQIKPEKLCEDEWINEIFIEPGIVPLFDIESNETYTTRHENIKKRRVIPYRKTSYYYPFTKTIFRNLFKNNYITQ